MIKTIYKRKEVKELLAQVLINFIISKTNYSLEESKILIVNEIEKVFPLESGVQEVEDIILTGRKFKNIHTDIVKEAIIPDPNLGLYESLMKLKEEGYNVQDLTDLQTALLNPHIFEEIIQK